MAIDWLKLGTVVSGGLAAALGVSLWYKDVRPLAYTNLFIAHMFYDLFVIRKMDKDEEDKKENKDVKIL